MNHVWIGNYRADNTGQDVIYAGNTAPDGTQPAYWDGTQWVGCGTKYPMRLSHFYIFNGIINFANRTGIQLSLCDSGIIYNNIVTDVGYENNLSQGDGIAIGGVSSRVHVNYNTVRRTFKYGIISFGKGKNWVEGNIVEDIGVLSVPASWNIDSLATTWGAQYGQPPYAYNATTRRIYSSLLSPANLVLQPDWDNQQNPLDSSTIVWRNNTLGFSLSATKMQVFDYFESNGKNPIGYFNYVCGNVLTDGTPYNTVGLAGQGSGDINFITNCASLPPVPDPDGEQGGGGGEDGWQRTFSDKIRRRGLSTAL
jgi:hypothetical protein